MNINEPERCEALKPTQKSKTVLSFLARRRSGMVKCMSGPGPDEQQLDLILRLAARVPDHRKLFPWRFLVFEGAAREQFGKHLGRLFQEDFPETNPERTQFEQERFLRAPLVIGVVSSPQDCPRGTPVWEQELSAGAVCQNMLLAARASGYAAQWLTEWYAFDERIDRALRLDTNERMAGFIYIGRQKTEVLERPRPEMASIVKKWPFQ